MKNKFYILAVAIIMATVFSGCKKDEPVAPTVVTKTASEITKVSAILKGEITNEGSAPITTCGFYYDSVPDMSYPMVLESKVNGNVFTAALTELNPGTTYYYRAYAVSNAGTAEGEIVRFATISAVAPTVLTVSVSDINDSGATLNGNVTAEGSDPITERGFMYGTSETNLSQRTECGTGTGTFNKALTGLLASTTYYFKAYATSDAGTSYGEIESFTTQSPAAPTIQTMSASNITQTGATINGKIVSTGTSGVTVRGFVYGTSATNLSQNVESTVTTENFNKAISGLAPSTTYYYKAYAVNSVGTSYGEVTSFTTLAPTAPTVVTGVATNITSQGATLNGNVTSDGGANVTARGFVYGTNQNNLTQNVSCGTGTGSMNYNLTLSVEGTYYYKAYATNSIGTTYGEVKTFDMTYINGHEYVDLGLPSGMLWATCNVGASSPTDYGGSYPAGTNVTWGGNWKTPTRANFQELIGSCSYSKETQGSVTGWRFTGSNGKSIFMPCGSYLSSTPYDTAWNWYYLLALPSSGNVNVDGYYSESNYPIRPCCPR